MIISRYLIYRVTIMKFQNCYREIHCFMKIVAKNTNFQHFLTKKVSFTFVRSYLSHFGLKLNTIFQLRYSMIFSSNKKRYKLKILSCRANSENNRPAPTKFTQVS